MENKYKLSNWERETIISFNDDEKTAEVYTCNYAWMRKMDKLCEEFPETFVLKRQDAHSKTYDIPKKFVAIRKPRILTDEQKQKQAERMRIMHAKNQI
jgi:hypothetical protein